MIHEEIELQLDDYVDGRLSESEVRRVEGHLEACDLCRAEVAGLKALLAEAADLPRSIEPPRDLWPAIERGTRSWRSRPIWSFRYQLAAAAILLMVASSVATAWLLRTAPPGGGDARVAVEPTVGASTAWRDSEEAYLQATAELLMALESRKERLDPEVVGLIEASLSEIDAAIQESRAALAIDPRNREIIEALSDRYQLKIEALKRLSRLTAQL